MINLWNKTREIRIYILSVKVKVKPRRTEASREGKNRYSTNILATSVLERGQHHAPVALLPGTTRYPLYRKLGGRGVVWLVWTGTEYFAPTEFEPRIVWPAASLNTDCHVLSVAYIILVRYINLL